MKKKSIFRQFLILMLVMLILPIGFMYSFVLSIFIGQLYDNYKDTVHLSSYISAQSVKGALGSVIDISVSIIGDEQVRDFLLSGEAEGSLTRFIQAQRVLDNYVLYNHYISHIYVSSIKGNQEISVGTTESYQFTDQETEIMLQSNGAWFWSKQLDGKMAICRLIRNTENNAQQLGFIKLVVRENRLNNQFYADEAEKQYSYVLIDSKENQVVLATDWNAAENYKHLLQNETDRNPHQREYAIRNNNQYLICRRIVINSRDFYLLVAAHDQTSYYQAIKYGVILLMVLLFSVLGGLYAVIYRKNIAVPLDVLRRQMKHIKPGSGAPEPVTVESKGEIKELVNAFNAMSVKLDTFYEINVKNELRLRDTRLMMLQSEINPHFLYNVLDSIRWMIELNEKEKASGMVEKLSEIFRLTLSSSIGRSSKY